MESNVIFRSKVDAWLVAVIVGVLSLCIAPMLFAPFNLVTASAVVFLVVILAFAIDMTFNISYVVDGEWLTINTGRLFRGTRVRIADIKSIQSTHTIISAPAASLDRLRICVGKYDEIIVSPKRKQEFIEALCRINPNIQAK